MECYDVYEWTVSEFQVSNIHVVRPHVHATYSPQYEKLVYTSLTVDADPATVTFALVGVQQIGTCGSVLAGIA